MEPEWGQRVYRMPINDDEGSLDWIGIHKHCAAVPKDALDKDDHPQQEDDSPVDEFGRYRSIEWTDEPDWYRPDSHTRGWIPLAKEGDLRRGAWARATRSRFHLLGPSDSGKWMLADQERLMVRNDLSHLRHLVEEVGESELLDSETAIPPLFEIDRVDLEFDRQDDVQHLGMDARRAALDMMGFLNWWTTAIPRWMAGLPVEVVNSVEALELSRYEKRGYLISVNRDWKTCNFSLLVKRGVPFFYVWGIFEMQDKRFHRLTPGVMSSWLAQNPRNTLADLWEDDSPEDLSANDPARHYDRFLELKIDPYSRPRNPLPVTTEISGDVQYDIIDFQHWFRRCVDEEDNVQALHSQYHHIVVESASERTTRVIFHRFHTKPRKEELNDRDEIMTEEHSTLDLSALRERFKDACAPRDGQLYDLETGIERLSGIKPDTPHDVVARMKREQLLLEPPGSLGSRAVCSDAYSMNHELNASGFRRGVVYPIRPRSPPPFRRNEQCGDTREVVERRANWLNNFRDWGAAATYEASLWRVPMEYTWNPEVLSLGYLLIEESAEFRLRYQAISNPAIRFPRHLLEVALERGIPFIIAFKRADCDRFRPTESDEDNSRTVTRAMVDLRARGPRLAPSPSVKTMYREYWTNLGRLGDSPQMRALLFKGGAASWIIRVFIGIGIVRRFLSGPSVQVSVYHAGNNDTGDQDSIDVTWDDVSDGDYEAVFGYIKGATDDTDRYLFPTDEMLGEFSDHYFREWNPFCEQTYNHLKAELDGGRGKARMRGEWKHYFQSSNRGSARPN
ncbi:hypothetical protein K438DRAFT_1682860, partial [Mycena galopus ATCC 62051]